MRRRRTMLKRWRIKRKGQNAKKAIHNGNVGPKEQKEKASDNQQVKRGRQEHVEKNKQYRKLRGKSEPPRTAFKPTSALFGVNKPMPENMQPKKGIGIPKKNEEIHKQKQRENCEENQDKDKGNEEESNQNDISGLNAEKTEETQNDDQQKEDKWAEVSSEEKNTSDESEEDGDEESEEEENTKKCTPGYDQSNIKRSSKESEATKNVTENKDNKHIKITLVTRNQKKNITKPSQKPLND
ncbi:uncharacterized protein LOC132047766 [Lycium ferocissimum]|uniref:uncharacterized protein LOC132047766 n=1 Tax=Lycium ferocissimum TaxID=112874 RepID=UPI0028152EC1|nr:uncharacterized protein LOC132047766 [Lycium ferocissimum]